MITKTTGVSSGRSMSPSKSQVRSQSKSSTCPHLASTSLTMGSNTRHASRHNNCHSPILTIDKSIVGYIIWSMIANEMDLFTGSSRSSGSLIRGQTTNLITSSINRSSKEHNHRQNNRTQQQYMSIKHTTETIFS